MNKSITIEIDSVNTLPRREALLQVETNVDLSSSQVDLADFTASSRPKRSRTPVDLTEEKAISKPAPKKSELIY